MKKILFAFVSLLIIAQTTVAQQDVAYWGKEDAYLLRQATQIYQLIDEALTNFPPTVGAPIERRLALYNLDAMLHETKYDNSEPFKQFVVSRMDKVIDDIRQDTNTGMKIYKIYNDGFVAKTKTVTIAFDLVRGSCNNQSIVSDEHIKAITDMCDVLFLTHNHGDHVDRFVVDCFLAKGKPVVAATEILPEVEGISHFRSETNILNEQIKLKNGKSLDVKIYPGHQSDMMCNVYVVTTPERLTVAHTGDQYNKADFSWIDHVKTQKPTIDALLINCWSMNISDAVNGFNPRYVITGHENEMGHTIDHREAFWLTFQKMRPIKHDYVVMAWGECFSFK